MPPGAISRAARGCGAAALLALSVITSMTGPAAGEEAADLRARMQDIRAELDAATAEIEALRTEQDETHHRIEAIESRMDVLERRSAKLRREAIERADALYRGGTTGMVELLFGSKDFGELQDRAEMLSQVSLEDASVFVSLARSHEELTRLDAELTARRAELGDTIDDLAAANRALQERFRAVAAEWRRLQAQLAPSQPVASAVAAAPVVRTTSGMACPVAGPHSFVDSWGAPRAGHTHQGVDMMAAYGTPLVAIVSGTITYAAYDGSGGNMIFLSGNDGNQYWYMHNQENLVTGGSVSVGQQIATVGDTGNATGTPHLHFEYHPGGGAAVNPYPLVAAIC